MQKAIQHIRNNTKSSFTPRQKKIFTLLFVGLFFLFLLLTLIVRADILRPFDFNTTVRIQDDIPVSFDHFFSMLSVFGRFEFTFLILLVILIFKRKLLGILTVGMFGIAHIVEIIGKTFLSQPGPPHMFLRTTDFSTEFPGLHIHTNASYPSGHSLRIIFIGILCATLLYINKRFPREFKYICFAFLALIVILMLVSRVSLGEHWTTDVIGGALLGASFVFLSLVFL